MVSLVKVKRQVYKGRGCGEWSKEGEKDDGEKICRACRDEIDRRQERIS
jgi:hypothetical protein